METRELTDQTLIDHLENIAADGMDVFLLKGGTIRGSLLQGTRLVNQMRRNHDLGILETLYLGQSYLAAGLLTSQMKSRDRLAITVEATGPAGGLTVESNVHGEVRGYLKNAPIEVDAPVESFDLAPFIESGILTVTRFPQGARQPYSGQVELQYRSVAKDLAHYFVVSEQTPTAFNLSIQFDSDGRVVGAGGLFLQRMPESAEEDAVELEEAVANVHSIGGELAAGETPSHLIHRYFGDFDAEIVGSRGVEFSCSCSKGRFARFIEGMSSDQIREIIDSGPFPMETTCWNCNSTYRFTQKEVESMYQRRKRWEESQA
jgi:molecular chaperone Hsp33